MRCLSIIALIVYSSSCLLAQTDRLCTTDTYHPNASSVLQSNKNNLETEIINTNPHYNILSNTKICLPVIVNNVYQTDDQKISIEAIKRQIEQLNKDFNGNNGERIDVHPYFENLIANIGIEFYLMDNEIAEEGNNSGINYYKTSIDTFNMNSYPNIKNSSDGGLSSINAKNYINIWVGNIEAGIKGYATFPNTESSNDDGIVVHYNNFGNNNKTLSHEMGHFLGLNHLFGIEEGICEGDDNVKDTPQTATAYKTCANNNLVANQCNDAYFEYDLTQNFMNLCNDECLKIFTNGQKIKMLYNLLTYRKPLLINNCNDDLTNNKLDISIVNLNTTPIFCNNELTLNYEICNVGKVDIHSFTFKLNSLLKDAVETLILPNQCIAYSQAVDLTLIRVNTFIAELTDVNNSKEEENLKNNVAEFDFRKASLIDLPFKDDFSNDSNWLIKAADTYNWIHVSDNGNTVKNDCYIFKPHPLNELSIGNLYSPVFKLNNDTFEDAGGIKIHTISFDVAYTKSTNDLILDYLFVERSNVCSASNYQLLCKVNLTEAATNLTEEQLLSQADNNGWKNFVHKFETETSVENLNLRLTYVSSNNNKLLIDNFEISSKSQAPLNVQTYISQNKAGCYPNPTNNGIVHFYAERYKGQFALVNLYNQLGELQESFQLNNYEQLNVSHLPNGHYYVTFSWDKKIVSQKLLLLK